jgi:hypothetical protein
MQRKPARKENARRPGRVVWRDATDENFSQGRGCVFLVSLNRSSIGDRSPHLVTCSIDAKLLRADHLPKSNKIEGLDAAQKV